MRSYETLAPFVVPRSANFVASDDEFSLYAVTTFKKHSAEFIHKVREKKWVPRDYKFKEGGKEEEAQEVRKTEAEEKRVWGETLRLGRTGWSEGVMCLVHVLVLRVFVETVLRYGLPLDYVSVLVKVSCVGLSNRLLWFPSIFNRFNVPTGLSSLSTRDYRPNGLANTPPTHRQIQNVRRKPYKASTASSHTSRATLSVEIRKVGRRKTRA